MAKKYISGSIAIILAISATGFTIQPKASALDPVYDWLIYDANGNSTGTFIEDKTEAQMQASYPACNGSRVTCFQNFNQAHTIPLGLFIKQG